jgi:hypothetical protein
VAKPSTDSVIEALLERHGQTYAEELDIKVAKGTPSVLFRLLVASILFSARIGAGQAVKAARALTEAGWTTAEKLAATSWQQRVRVLNRHGYARYDERTASMLGDACELLLDRYRGDLRRLRAEAGQDQSRNGGCLSRSRGWVRWVSTSSSRRPRSPGRNSSRSSTGGPPRPPAGSA